MVLADPEAPARPGDGGRRGEPDVGSGGRALAAAFELGIPVTPRGTGTGNYGQAMPLSGGIVLDLSGFDAVKHIAPGRIVAEPGAVIAAIDRLTRPHSAQEIRLHPSTYNTASIGGFVAGGSGGVGSIKWGGLRDAGNIIRLKIVTMEKTPRVLELAGEELHKVAHAYGTNGIITEVEMPLAPAYDWIDLVLGFDTLAAAASYANALGEEDGPDQAARGHRRARAARRFSPSPETRRDKHLALAMVAPHALDALLAFTRRFRNAEVLLRQDQMSETDLKGLPPVFELVEPHDAAGSARRPDLHVPADPLSVSEPARPRRAHPCFGDEVPAHLEFVRFDGKVTCFGLPLVRFTTEERLEEIIAIHEEMAPRSSTRTATRWRKAA